MAKNEAPRIAVLGAGPIGLEAALYARKLGLPVTVYERGRIGEHILRWGHVRLFSPFGMNSTALGRAAIRADQPRHDFPGDSECITGREHFSAYLEPVARSTLLANTIQTETQILAVGRGQLLKDDSPADNRRAQEPFRILTRQNKNREEVVEADVVLDCTGTYGQHRWLGRGGIPAIGELNAEPNIVYAVDDVLGDRRQHYAGKSVLVVGGGYSAATTVCNLSTLAEEHAATWVIWLARGQSTQPIKRVPNDPLRERDRLAVRANTLATRGEGNIEFHANSMVESIENIGTDKGFKVTARCGSKEMSWDFERVIANVGYTPDTQIYRELQVHECYATLGPMGLATALSKHAGADCLQSPSQGAATLRNPEPHFYILGAKSFGRNSHFLLRTGFEQVRDVFSLIAAKPNLDLYKSTKS